MKQDTTPNDKAPKKGSLKERVKKHLTDKNDVITEEDMKNIKIGGEEGEEKTAEELAKALEEKKQTSPWTILTEEDK